MALTKIIATAAAASLAAAPAMAAPNNPAASLSLGKSVRAGSTAKHSDGLRSGGIIALVIAAGVVAGIVTVVVRNNDDSPSSP